jgi:hypothetical protein
MRFCRFKSIVCHVVCQYGIIILLLLLFIFLSAPCTRVAPTRETRPIHMCSISFSSRCCHCYYYFLYYYYYHYYYLLLWSSSQSCRTRESVKNSFLGCALNCTRVYAVHIVIRWVLYLHAHAGVWEFWILYNDLKCWCVERETLFYAIKFHHTFYLVKSIEVLIMSQKKI